MTTTDLKATEQQYADLMVEAKVRLSALEQVFTSHTDLPAIAMRDFGYIELRMLCELIALACLVAHGDIPATKTKRLRETWNAGYIINALDKLHAEFFPRAATQELIRPHRFKIILLPKGDVFSKEELKRLYTLAGEKLHRGDITTLGRFTKQSLTADTDEIIHWTNRIADLLNIHFIRLLDGRTSYVCTLKTLPDGRVSLSSAGKLEQGEPGFDSDLPQS